MDVRNCYKQMGGDYEEAIRLMGNDERIIRYLKIFRKDTNFSSLCYAIQQNDMKAAFHAAHTIKGVALNLSLTSLAVQIKDLTEILRIGILNEEVLSLLQKTEKTYALVLESIETLINESLNR